MGGGAALPQPQGRAVRVFEGSLRGVAADRRAAAAAGGARAEAGGGPRGGGHLVPPPGRALRRGPCAASGRTPALVDRIGLARRTATPCTRTAALHGPPGETRWPTPRSRARTAFPRPPRCSR